MSINLNGSDTENLAYAWEYSMSHGTLKGTPLLAGDRLICLTNSEIFALDIYTGEEVGSEEGFPYLRHGSVPPPTHSRGTVYFVNEGELVALQLSDGKPPTRRVNGQRQRAWKEAPKVDDVVSVSASSNLVVVCQADPATSATGFDALTGKPVWGPVRVSPLSSGNVGATRDALFLVSSGRLIAINIRSGDTRFTFAPSGSVADPLSDEETPQVGEVGDKAIVVAAGIATYGVDLSNGKQLWVQRATHPSPNTHWLTPAISESYDRVVLANTDGDVFVLQLTTGALRWSAHVPGVEQVNTAGDKVYISVKPMTSASDKISVGQHVAQLQVYNLLASEKQQLDVVLLDEADDIDIVVGHGILFTCSSEYIRAIPFAKQNAAALFRQSHEALITVPDITAEPVGTQFDFGQGDFTIEAWIATTCGGEIISGFPTADGDAHHGFRVNVSEQGRLRFSVINQTTVQTKLNSFAAISACTNVADGSWHHVAVVRRGNSVEMYLDGVSVAVDSERRGSAALDISGKNSLTFGAFVPGRNARPESYFNGLMREMRLWDIALDTAKLQSRMGRVLVGTEPHLLGYWRMDEVDISKLKDQARHAYTAKVHNVRSFVTELVLDTSAFPYLLDQVNLQWPYSGHWSARGANEITTAPALERSGMLCFGAGNALYGVHTSDGTRAWDKSTPAGTSAPVAARGLFYALTGDEGLVSIDAHTGVSSRVKELEKLSPPIPPPGTRLSAPATDDRYIIAAWSEGDVWVVDLTEPSATANAAPWTWKAPEKLPGDLTIADGRLYLVAGQPVAGQTLHQLDLGARKELHSVRVAGTHFLVDGDLVFCMLSPGKVVALSTSDLTKQKASFDVPDGSTVTGLASAPDADLLVVATDKGVLYGLTFATLATRWTRSIPAGTASASNALYTPAISGRTVFCTTASGAVGAVDAQTGEMRGLFFEPTKITTPPLADAGVIYFGCADAPPKADRDGALHSVVFGQTHVLRLGCDHKGARETAHGYASVMSADILELQGVDECCVEAWVNTGEGGEILSICPSAKSGYGLRLWLERDGAINFTCTDLPEDTAGRWQRITARAASHACDGKWHHLAVSRSGRKELTIYLDGVAVNTKVSLDEVAAPALVDGLKLFIGADATATTPANFYAGMIGEIRIWDTYLTATRIAARMHEKLVGDEPDLLAYWNFDALSIHDGSRNGHDGKLETGGGSSGYWVTDLNFTHPGHPYIETEGRIIQEGEEGGTGELAKTIYQLTVTVCKADGAPLPERNVTLWYVRHKGETGPDTITVSSPNATEDIHAVGPEHGDEQSTPPAKTGKDGKVVFKISTTQHGHGPSLDLRADFLPPNERYHVSVLIDEQKLEKPAPPRLEAQVRLIQDYHWETGDKVDHTRDRSTWRAVIRALNSDGTPRAGERIQLWAQEHVEAEVGGRKYPINPNNYQSFIADNNGELTVALSADDLHAPALSVWAGFMHREERYTIPLDGAAHGDLAKVTGDDLAKPRMTNWKRDYKPGDDKAIVTPGYKPHAEKVATAIRHVMSVSQEPDKGKRAPRSKRPASRVDLRDFSDMQRIALAPRTDRVQMLRTLRHINRQTPLEPESFRESLARVSGFEGSIGFVFKKTKEGFELSPYKSLAEVHAEFRPTPPPPRLVGNIFEDVWDAIEDAAEAVWREAQKIAVFIADQVTLAIEYADKVVTKVVSSVIEAVEAVVHIIKMIEALIEDVIRFLRLLLDWGGIIEAHKILKEISQKQLQEVKRLTEKGTDEFKKMLAAMLHVSTDKVDLSTHRAASTTARVSRENDPHPQVHAEVNSVHGKYVTSKTDDGRDQIVLNVNVKPSEVPDPAEGVEEKALQLAGAFGGALSNPLNISFKEIYETFRDLLAGDVDKLINRILDAAFKDFGQFGKVIEGLETFIDAEIHIPFLSDLYKWITDGEPLTLFNVICLALAIPTHIGYAVYSAIISGGTPHRFVDDYREHGLLGDSSLAATALHDDDARRRLAAGRHNAALHWAYFIFYELYTVSSATLKAEQVLEGDAWMRNAGARTLAIPPVVCGLACRTLVYTAAMKGEESWDDFEQGWQSAAYGINIGLDLYTAYDALFGTGEDGGGGRDPWIIGQLKKLKALKDPLKVGASIGGYVLLVTKINEWVGGKSSQSDLFQIRDVLNAVALIMTFKDTAYFIKIAGRGGAARMVTMEAYVKAAAGMAHITAVATE